MEESRNPKWICAVVATALLVGGCGSRGAGPVPMDAPDGGPEPMRQARVWSRPIGSGDAVTVESLVVGPDGGFVVAGLFGAPTDFGRGPNAPYGSIDAFVAAYDARGELRWARPLGGTGNDQALAAAIAEDGSVHVGGKFYDTVDFGDGPAHTAVGWDAFVVTFSPDGALTRVITLGGTGNDEVRALVAGDGRICATGSYRDDLAAGHLLLTGGNAFAACFAANDGSTLWLTDAGADATVDVRAMAIATDGATLAIAGRARGGARLGGTSIASAGGFDAFVLALETATGATRFVRTLGGDLADGANGIVALDAGGWAIAGDTGSTALDVAGTAYPTAGGNDAFVATLAADGTVTAGALFGGSGFDGAADVTVADGAILVAGSFEGAVTLASGDTLSAQGSDAWLLTLDDTLYPNEAFALHAADGAAMGHVAANDTHALVAVAGRPGAASWTRPGADVPDPSPALDYASVWAVPTH